METKHCNGCDTDKPLTEFYIRKSGPQIGKPSSHCRTCITARVSTWRKSNSKKAYAACRVWAKTHPERVKKFSREYTYRHGAKPASENKSCSAYLGCVIAETILSHEFPGFKRMPNGNPGYDYDCPKGHRIDAKSSCRNHHEPDNDRWIFQIRKNKSATDFLLLAVKSRKDLIPEHVWFIPGYVINDKITVSISDSPRSLAKWSKYERSLKNVLNCCDKLRGGDVTD